MSNVPVAEPTARFELTPRGPFALAESRRFLTDFRPAAYSGDSGADHLDLVFVVDGSETPVGVRLHEAEGRLRAAVYGQADLAVVSTQVARILSLDLDASDFPTLADQDPIVARLQERYPGARPVCFNSPFEAAAWALISHRVRLTQAAVIRARLVEARGPTVLLAGEERRAFPGPLSLIDLESFPGLFGRKPEWLRELAAAALNGQLEAATLRGFPPDQARASLKALPGIGDFSADLVLLRGAGAPDLVPANEPRLRRAIALAYGLAEEPSFDQIVALAERWRPYRTWVCVLLRRFLDDEISNRPTEKRPAR